MDIRIDELVEVSPVIEGQYLARVRKVRLDPRVTGPVYDVVFVDRTSNEPLFTASLSGYTLEPIRDGQPVPERVLTVHVPLPGTNTHAEPETEQEDDHVKSEFRCCRCGCGGRTGGGFFLPGHDARAKGLLKRVLKGDLGLTDVPPALAVFVNEESGKWYREFGFGRATDPERESRFAARREVQA